MSVRSVVVAAFFLLSTVRVRGVDLDVFQVPDAGEMFSSAVVSGQHIFVATQHYLYRLSSNLTEEERRLFTPFTRLLLVSNNSPSGNDLLLICGQFCSVVRADDIYNQVWPSHFINTAVPRVLNESTEGRQRGFTGDFRLGDGPGRFELTYAHSDFVSGLRSSDAPVASRIVRGTLFRAALENAAEMPDKYEVAASQIELDPLQEREFIQTFTRNGFTYFVSVMSFASGPQARIARVCNSDKGLGNGTDGDFTSYIELALRCGDATGEPSAATFVPTPNAFLTDTLVLSVGITRLSEVRNRLCAYDVTLIDQMMSEKITECANGVGMSGLKRNIATRMPCVEQQVCTYLSFKANIVAYMRTVQVTKH